MAKGLGERRSCWSPWGKASRHLDAPQAPLDLVRSDTWHAPRLQDIDADHRGPLRGILVGLLRNGAQGRGSLRSPGPAMPLDIVVQGSPALLHRNVRFAIRNTLLMQRGGGGFTPNQMRGGKFRGAPWILCITPRQSPQCVLLVSRDEKFAENPELRVGNVAVNLKREISHAKSKCHETPPPPNLLIHTCVAKIGCFTVTCPWTRLRQDALSVSHRLSPRMTHPCCGSCRILPGVLGREGAAIMFCRDSLSRERHQTPIPFQFQMPCKVELWVGHTLRGSSRKPMPRVLLFGLISTAMM